MLTELAKTRDSPLRITPDWPAAFHTAGADLARLAEQGHLTRGLRAVLAHHILFALNRLGIPPGAAAPAGRHRRHGRLRATTYPSRLRDLRPDNRRGD